MIENWYSPLKCQTWSTNTKPFFWESEANLETLQKLSPYIRVSYKFVLTSVKKLNRIFLMIEIASRLYNAIFGWEIQNRFSGKARQTLKLYKNFFLILGFSINLFWSLSKAWIESSESWNTGWRLYYAKFGWRIQNHFSEKVTQTLKLS